MDIKRYDEYIVETRINPVKIQLDRFEGLKHKIIRCNTGSPYNVWYSDDIDVCKKITHRYTGKHALDLGGYSPSENDVFLKLGDYCLIIKTNRDDIVPREVILDASDILISLVDKEDVVIDMCKCFQISSGQMPLNYGRIVFRSGNISFEL
jgi:hypothetical protein